jgi:diacylglycerol kinase (ATP)
MMGKRAQQLSTLPAYSSKEIRAQKAAPMGGFLRYYGGMDEEAEKFSIVKRAKSFTHAGRGIMLLVRTTHNAWIHFALLGASILLGLYFRISQLDWSLLVFAGGFVIAAEAFNTAIEIDIDLTSPEYHPFARDTKDVAAGAVLIAAITAAIVGLFIFVPYIVQLGDTFTLLP